MDALRLTTHLVVAGLLVVALLLLGLILAMIAQP